MSLCSSFKFADGKAILGARVNNGKIELLIGRIDFHKKIEHRVQHFARLRVFPVDLIDDDNRLNAVLERLSQHKTRLGLGTVVRVDHEQDAVHHFHDPLHFAAEIGMAGRIDDIDAVIVPSERGILCANGDSLFALEIHRIHHAFLDFLVGAKRPRLAQQLIDKRGLAVIDVRNDGDVADLFHGEVSRL